MTMQTIDLPCESQDRRWEKYKSTIIQLYMHEGYTLHKVMEIMESRYNFKARYEMRCFRSVKGQFTEGN